MVAIAIVSLLVCSSCVKDSYLDRSIPVLDVSGKASEVRNLSQTVEMPKNEKIRQVFQQTLNEAADAWQECQIALAKPDTKHHRVKGVNFAWFKSGMVNYRFFGVADDGRFTSCQKKTGDSKVYHLATRYSPSIIGLEEYSLLWYRTLDKKLKFNENTGILFSFDGSVDGKRFGVSWSEGKIYSESIR